MSFRWTSMRTGRVSFGRDADNAVTVLVFGVGGGGGGPVEPGDAAWGGIGGTLTDQADLVAALNGKANTSHTQGIATITGLSAALNAITEDIESIGGVLDGLGSAAGEDVDAFDAAGTAAGEVSDHAAETEGVHGISAFGATVIAAPDQATARGLLDAAASSHTHAASQITSGTLAVNRGGTGSTGFIAPTNYTAASATVSAHLAGIDTAIGNRAAATHTHNASAINDGTLDRARLPTVRGSKAIVVPAPVVGDRIGYYTRRAQTLQQIRAVLVGSSSPSVTWTLRYASDRSAAGTPVVTAGTTTTTTTAAQEVTSFDESVIPASSHVWLEISAVSGDVDQIEVTPDYEEAA